MPIFHEIPTPPITANIWTSTVSLGDQEFLFAWRLIERLDRWSIDISEKDGAAVISGRHVMPNVDLLNKVPATSPRPEGQIIALAGDGSSTPPGRENLGKTIQLYWLEPDA